MLEALGAEIPVYAHVGNVLGTDGKKLSKRHGAVGVDEFRREGYLPEALVNYLALLGWSYDDRTTIMSRAELIERFTLERVAGSPATFDYEKLEWMNGVYLRALEPEAYADALTTFLGEQGLDWDAELARRTVPIVTGEARQARPLPGLRGLLLPRRGARSEAARRRGAGGGRVGAGRARALRRPRRSSRRCARFAESLGLKPRQAFQSIRVAVTGTNVSPSLFESIELLGREKTLERLRTAAALAGD